jgi:hypothetical protein
MGKEASQRLGARIARRQSRVDGSLSGTDVALDQVSIEDQDDVDVCVYVDVL